ncbi:MAG: hypothetical protein RRB13_03085 [bacterium]|nr:hypothetical protein [bacterium]
MSGYQTFLITHMLLHLAVAAPLFVLAYNRWNKAGLLVVFAGSWGIDSDHFIHLITKPTIAVQRLLDGALFDSPYPFLPLHSVELALALMWIGWKYSKRAWPLLLLGFSFTIHIGFDLGSYMASGLHPLYYSYTGWLLGVAQDRWILLP